MTPGSCSPGRFGLDGHQIEVPGTRSNTSTPGARRAPDAVQQRERDADSNALLDRQHDDRRRGHDDQKEFAERLPVDRNDLADADDPQGDEQQHAAERRVRNSAEQRGTEGQQRDHDRRGGEAGELGSSAGLGHDGGARRAGIDRKRADQSRQDTADADADEVAIDIRRLVGTRTGKDRVVAAVCTMTTIAMMRLSDTRLGKRPAEISGIASAGSATETAPRTLTPRLSSPSSTTPRSPAASPIKAPGIRASIRSDSGDDRQHARCRSRA